MGRDAKVSRRRTLDRLYAFLVEEEDARVCKDIPALGCVRSRGNAMFRQNE